MEDVEEEGGGEERFVSSPEKRQFDAGVAAALCRGMLKVRWDHYPRGVLGVIHCYLGSQRFQFCIPLSTFVSVGSALGRKLECLVP